MPFINYDSAECGLQYIIFVFSVVIWIELAMEALVGKYLKKIFAGEKIPPLKPRSCASKCASTAQDRGYKNGLFSLTNAVGSANVFQCWKVFFFSGRCIGKCQGQDSRNCPNLTDKNCNSLNCDLLSTSELKKQVKSSLFSLNSVFMETDSSQRGLLESILSTELQQQGLVQVAD